MINKNVFHSIITSLKVCNASYNKRTECEPSQLVRTESNEAENKAAEKHSTLMTIIWFFSNFFFHFFDVSGHFEQIKKKIKIFFLKIWWFRGVNHWGWKGRFWSNCHKNADLCSLETSLWPTKFLYRLLAWSKRKSCSKSDKILSPKNLKSQKNSTKKW